MTSTVGCVQPSYMPWIPFFKRFINCDYFVILDDVDYSKNSNQNRNYINMDNAKNLLTVPVHYKSKCPINQIKIEILSPDGELLNFRQDHNITIEIMESRDVLKETLLDTKQGDIITTGVMK